MDDHITVLLQVYARSHSGILKYAVTVPLNNTGGVDVIRYVERWAELPAAARYWLKLIPDLASGTDLIGCEQIVSHTGYIDVPATEGGTDVGN